MEKKTIGSFIAAMRKANGLTQQDVADRLNVSNKTVSKWECNESYPDIALIPVLAELFGVSCDEILAGTRFAGPYGGQYEQKVGKQIKRIANSAVVKFKNMSLVSALLTVVGLIVLFAVSYAFFRPIIGFALNAIFIATSLVFVFVQYNLIVDLLKSDDLPRDDNVSGVSMVSINRGLFLVICLNIFSLIFSMPFIIVRNSYYINGVITIEAYMSYLPLLLLFCVATGMLGGALFASKLALPQIVRNVLLTEKLDLCMKMNIMHAVLLLIVIPSAFATSNVVRFSFEHYVASWLLVIACVLILVSPVAFVLKEKGGLRKAILAVSGIRNILLVFATCWIVVNVKYYVIGLSIASATLAFYFISKFILTRAYKKRNAFTSIKQQ